MAAVAIELGLGLAALSVAGRLAVRAMPRMAKQAEAAMAKNKMSVSDVAKAWANAKYYRGGFEPKMSRREAALILGVSPASNAKRVSETYKRVMLLNHPDRGGSPFMAAKINQAKDMLVSRSS